MQPRFHLPATPHANPEAVLTGPHWRVTVLTDGLLRLEWSNDGGFEDRASTFAWHRDLPVPPFQVIDGEDHLEVLTERLHLRYDRGPFSASGLSVQARGRISNHRSTWRYGTTPRALGGTARTLDDVDGRIALEPGITSRDGVGVLDDSRSFLFTDDGWIAPREGEDRLDLYVFAYGHDYTAALQAFYAVSGPQPVLPRWALGNWWSRYHRYSAESYLALLDRFEDEQLPFSVAVLDMDWHKVDSVPERYGTGWTGYTWEPELFADPPAFLAELHRRGLRATLNLHPHEGVQPFEDVYPAMARALGVDPDSDLGIPFDVTDPDFMTAYFEVLHHGLEEQGVDFWWIDWQQGTHSRIPGVDPLWMLNHFHFLDSGRQDRRPLTFTRYAGPGSHRYPVGFSGDTIISWASLDFQPEFTAAASDLGFGWWSHDIGGHLAGVRDDDLATRWAQYGVFSPINRLHSSSNPFLVKEPWMYPGQARAAMSAALRLRHRLVPYLHTMNHRSATQGLPLVRPMYHLHPGDPRAYTVPNQYAFGDQLLVAPITSPRDPVTLTGSVRAWLPEGVWGDIFTGHVYDGDRELTLHRDEDSIPVLLPAGGMLVLAGPAELDAAKNPDHLEVLLLPGADGRAELVEDDGTGTTPETIPAARTPLTWNQDEGRLVVGPASGPAGVLPEERSWTVTVLGLPEPPEVLLDGRGLPVTSQGARHSVTVTGVRADAELVLQLPGGLQPATDQLPDRLFGVLNAAQLEHQAKLTAWQTLCSDLPDHRPAGRAAGPASALHAAQRPDRAADRPGLNGRSGYAASLLPTLQARQFASLP